MMATKFPISRAGVANGEAGYARKAFDISGRWAAALASESGRLRNKPLNL